MRGLESWVEQNIAKNLGADRITPVAGGEACPSFRLDGLSGSYFLKINTIQEHSDMLEKEVLGLKIIDQIEGLKVPLVHSVGKTQQVNYMLTEWVERTEPDMLFWENFGFEMAQLHQKTYPFYGFITDNYVGIQKQANMGCHTWSDFFILYRLVPLVGEAYDKNLIDQLTLQKFEALYNRIPEIFSDEPPSLLHGDFWYGNYICDQKNQPVLVDPACYYGNRIMDIAMSKLFGGFPDTFYQAYNSVWHLPYGWNDSVEIANLYPLLLHVNRFGGQYGTMIKNILYRF